MKIEGTEYCGCCNNDFDFEVEEDVWIVNCETCGRPTVLCDKCHTMELDDDCSNCKHCAECRELEKKWMKGEVGKVYYVDSSLFLNAPLDIENGWYKVLEFDGDGAYILENIENHKKIKTYGELIDYDEKFEN